MKKTGCFCAFTQCTLSFKNNIKDNLYFNFNEFIFKSKSIPSLGLSILESHS